MAVQGIKGGGIGQVAIPTAEEALRQQYLTPISEIARRRAQNVAAGALPTTADVVGEVPEQFFQPDTQLGAIGNDFLIGLSNIGQFGTDLMRAPFEIGRIAYEGAGELGSGLGEVLKQPTERKMKEIIEQQGPGVEADLSPFREAVRRQGQQAPELISMEDPYQVGEKQFDGIEFDAQNAINNLEQGLSGDVRDGDDLGTAVTATEDDTTDKPYDPYGGMIEDQMRAIEALKGNDPDAKNTEDYMKEFAEATGVNIDGKADKSQALMAFGLALMQNKAGKGFDVSKALSALGEAGTAAAPAFQKAKDTARAERIAAGKYGLQQVAKDATARASSLSAAQGRLSDLMKTNIDAQTKRDIEILKGRNSFTLERFKNEAAIAKAQLEAGNVDLYNTGKPESIPLFKDAPDIFKIDVFTENPNAKLKAGQEIPVKLTNATVKRMGNVFAAAERGLNSAEEEVVKLSNIINNENITPQNQLLELASSMGRAFGINVDSDLGPAAQAKYILDKIATQKAPEILNEAGKTISDADRERVSRVVGEIKLITDPKLLNEKIAEIYKLTVQNGRKNLDQAYGTLHSYGHNYGPYAQQQSSGDLSAEEEAELAQLQGD
tara:strand:- start:432 stop:2252 length:1821 start_codon:yes stop_codon:yes gene_type:complete